MRLIIGLGNIGLHFDGTRHNIGFMAVETYAAGNNIIWQSKDKFKASLAEAKNGDTKIILAKPATYYNCSGDAVRAIKDFYKIANHDILVVHDELALAFGTVRTRSNGSDAGNNGIKSIVAAIGADFTRIRVGIANHHTPAQDAADFVLGQFSREERQQLPDIHTEVQRLINAFIQHGSLPHTSWRAVTGTEILDK